MAEPEMHKRDKQNVIMQEVKVRGEQLVDKVREVIEEGNARRLIIKKDGRTLIEFPLSVGVGGATAAVFFAPTLAAIGAFAALVTDVTIQIEREAKPGDQSRITDPNTPTNL